MSHDNSGYIEFIARTTSYDQTAVSTKAGVEDIESAVYNAFLLIFDNSGNRILCSEVTNPSTTPSKRVPIDKGLSNVTACFLINVPSSFANGIKGLTKPTNDATALDNEYINTAVLSGISYGTGANFGLPFIDLDGPAEGSSPAVACIPMFGMASVNLQASTTTAQITIKRLFAKVTMNIKMQLTDIGIGQIVPSTVNYELKQYQLHCLPTQVSLLECQCVGECSCECAWVKDKTAFYGNTTTPLSSSNNLALKTININDSDDNTENDSNVVEGIGFSFYVPEYYLLPNGTTTQDQKSKPKNYDSKKYPIYLELIGEVNRSLIDNTSIRHKIYLGGNAIDDYTLIRNKNYINQITLMGINDNEKGTEGIFDYRVSTEIINNPVAKEGKAANCYIIATPGKYTIPAYKGAYNNLNGATLCMAGKNIDEYETRVEVLANVVEYESLTSITFSSLPTYDPETNTISFTVNQMLSDAWVPNGSVIIALQYRQKGTTAWITEWSWHLWFVYKITESDDGWGMIGTQKMPDQTTNIMDRNLGVHAFTNAGTKPGFYYKYGEHVPYLDPDGDGTFAKYGGGILYDSNSQPVTPTWSATKSPTDPCPPGYKVPGQIFSANNLNTSSSSRGYNYSSSISFPYSRSLSLSGNLADKTQTSNTYPDHTGYSNSSTDNDQLSGDVVDITESTDGKTQYGYKLTKVQKTFTNYKYSVKSTTDFGYLWSNDNSAYKYNFNAIDWTQFLTVFSVVSADVKVVTTKQPVKRTKRSAFGQTFWGTWNYDGSSTTVTTNTKATSDFPTGTTSTLMYRIYDNPDGAPVGNGNAAYTDQTSSIAAPVRCQKE